MKTQLSKFTGIGFTVLALVIAFFAILSSEEDYLYRVEELNLFLYTLVSINIFNFSPLHIYMSSAKNNTIKRTIARV